MIEKILKIIFELHKFKLVDCNDYYDDKDWKKKFDKITKNRIVSYKFLANKIKKAGIK